MTTETLHARTSHCPTPPPPPPHSPSDPPSPDNIDRISYAVMHDPSVMEYETQPTYLRTSDTNILHPHFIFAEHRRFRSDTAWRVTSTRGGEMEGGQVEARSRRTATRTRT